MATIASQKLTHPFSGDVHVYLWEAMAANDVGESVVIPRFSDVTVHMVGTFGGAVTLEGTCNPAMVLAEFIGLRDHADAAISETADNLRSVQENVYGVRPVAAAAVSDVDVYLLVR